MAVTFTYVPPIEPGTPVSSDHLNTFADGINDRLRSGLADGPWRIMFYAFSAFRQIRNSDETGFLFPPQHEFFSAYQNISPDEFRWPNVEPGEAEGVNVASIMGAFVFGSDAGDLWSEDIRVADDTNGGVPIWPPPQNPEEIWELGKRQRGAFDPTSGYMASPSFYAATEHYKISPYRTSPHGNSWGGYMPAPAIGAICAEPEFQNYQIFFTHLETGAIFGPFGSCPEDPAGVAGVSRTPRYYIVYWNDGSAPAILLMDAWIEGPYTGGAFISKQSGEHIPRVLNAFASDFRCTEDQRAAQTSWLAHAFDIQRFMESQYHLAPQRGAGDEFIVGPIYPRWEATGETTYAAGTVITTTNDETFYDCHAGFLIASAFVKLTGLESATTIEILDGDELLATVEAEPDESGNFSQIVTFETASAYLLQVRFGSAAQFTSSAGTVTVEATELLEYKPQIYDLYLCLRLASCRVELEGGMDGSGTTEEGSKEISDAYFANGCITNIHESAGPAGVITEVNTNAVFDAARRLSKFVHIIPRNNFIGYEVTGGKSICYFRREGPGGQDLFDGIGPSREQIESGGLQADRRYTVRSGQILYRGRHYETDDVFTAVHPDTEFEGEGAVFEYDGIYATAPREGMTNEWLMGHHFKVSHPSDSSIWKSDAYSDFWTISERCHFYGTHTADFAMQLDYGSALSIAPESPTGWRYAKNTNVFPCPDTDPGTCEERRRDRYKSCRIYEPDPEIESATVLIEGGHEIIKLTFTGRLHYHESAVGSVSRDVGTWDTAALNAESYRTTENGLREYLVWAHTGAQCTQSSENNLAQQGNSAEGVPIWSAPDNPYGACFPTFYFVKLFPKAYEDGNTSQQSHDTPLMADWWMQADFYVRAMCEGYVDGLTSTSIGCDSGINALFDYTHEALFFEATGKKWPTTLPTTATSYISSEHIRDDAPQGFGQTPNTILSSEVYNQFAAALNLLTDVRVMLPMNFETRYSSGSDSRKVTTARDAEGSPLSCATVGPVAGWWSGVPHDASVSSPGGWTSDFSVVSGVGASIDMFSCDGTDWNLIVERSNGEWRWNYQDPDAEYAIPEHWRDMVLTSGRIVAIRQRIKHRFKVEIAADIGDSQACDGTSGHWFNSLTGDYYKFTPEVISSSETCEVLSAGGTVVAPPLTNQDLAIGRTAGGVNCHLTTQNDESVEPILGDDTAFISIPLV